MYEKLPRAYVQKDKYPLISLHPQMEAFYMTTKQYAELKKKEAEHHVGKVFRHGENLYRLTEIRLMPMGESNYQPYFIFTKHPFEPDSNNLLVETIDFARNFHEV